jgi:5'-3' exonuclease
MSLFNEDGMRKGTKSSLYVAFSPLPQDFQLPQRSMVVIDGGYLLHKVIWNRSSTFGGICQGYVKYVQRHYGTNVMVIFDGYPTDPSQQGTKTAERARRYKANLSSDVVFNKTTVNTTPQDTFLANEGNKDRFVKLLSTEMQASNIATEQAYEDADRLIVVTAKCLSPKYDAVVIVGEDIDLLVLLTGITPMVNNVYLKKPARGKQLDTIYSASSYKYNSKGCILLLHAISGCDTTSNIFGFGKNKFCQLFMKDPTLLDQAERFGDPAATAQEISAAGEKILVSLYGGSREQSLSSLRHCKFKTSTTKLNLAKLPPTTDTAHFHFLRTYHQVMEWMGIAKDPIEYGWCRRPRGLEPIRMSRDAAPPNLLKTISCRCTTGCMGACGCRKAGLNCSALCKFCAGQECENRNEVIVDNEDDDDLVTS